MDERGALILLAHQGLVLTFVVLKTRGRKLGKAPGEVSLDARVVPQYFALDQNAFVVSTVKVSFLVFYARDH